jgi:fructose-1,6-bisphosphatase II
MSEQVEMERNLAMELVRATEAAALNAARWMGKGDKNASDQAAVDALRRVLNSVDMDGIVVIGEGEKDEAPMLYEGEQIGNGNAPKVDIAVDPIDGTRLLAQGMPNSIAVLTIAERGTMYAAPPGIFYMQKIAVGPEAAEHIDINQSTEWNIKSVAAALRLNIEDITVVVLDRPRHEQLIKEIRMAGARIKLITDGDVVGALSAAMPDTGVNMLMGIGGAPEGVLAACGLKCIGGNMQAKPWPRNDEDRRKAAAAGTDLNKVFGINDLVSGEDIFFAATGITDGELLEGVHYFPNGATTTSIAMRSRSGTIRYVKARHSFDKLMRLSTIPYQTQGKG